MFPHIHLTDSLNLPTYLLLCSFAYCVCLIWLVPRSKKLNVNRNTALDISLVIMVSGFIGARLLHVIYEEPKYYLNDPMQVFQFWRGGFVFYGGLIGSLIGCYIYVKIKNLSFLKWGDFFAPMIPLGYAIGRLGCFFNGCCYGGVCDLPWAVNFPNILPLGIGRHPTQLYVVIWELLLLIGLLNIEKFKKLKTGNLLFIWLFFHSIGRIGMEYLRDDPRGDTILNLSISTWISFVLLLISSWFLLLKNNKEPQS